jgi:hypothetical protein
VVRAKATDSAVRIEWPTVCNKHEIRSFMYTIHTVTLRGMYVERAGTRGGRGGAGGGRARGLPLVAPLVHTVSPRGLGFGALPSPHGVGP